MVDTVRRVRPEAILEFGSGGGTVALAWAVREAWGASTPPRVLSLEQDAEHVQRTRALLERAGLGGEVLVFHAPLAEQQLEGAPMTCYAIPTALQQSLGPRRVDFVVIDGPAGPAGIRFGTMPLARPLVRAGATFLLDDALRDGELEIARRWSRFPSGPHRWAAADEGAPRRDRSQGVMRRHQRDAAHRVRLTTAGRLLSNELFSRLV